MTTETDITEEIVDSIEKVSIETEDDNDADGDGDDDNDENEGGGANSAKTPVSLLQELYVRRGLTPKYDLVQIEGAVHEPTFKYRVTIGDFVATGCYTPSLGPTVLQYWA